MHPCKKLYVRVTGVSINAQPPTMLISVYYYQVLAVMWALATCHEIYFYSPYAKRKVSCVHKLSLFFKLFDKELFSLNFNWRNRVKEIFRETIIIMGHY